MDDLLFLKGLTACQRVIVAMTAIRLSRFLLILFKEKEEEGSGHIV